jgi:transcriptional regulator with XRE-family HTH domain
MAKNVDQKLGQRIREAAQRQGLTQTEIARRMGKKNSQTISEWMRGEAAPASDQAVLLARVLGVSVSWLLTGEEYEGSLTEDRVRATDAMMAGATKEEALGVVNPGASANGSYISDELYAVVQQRYHQFWASLTWEEKVAEIGRLVALTERREPPR